MAFLGGNIHYCYILKFGSWLWVIAILSINYDGWGETILKIYEWWELYYGSSLLNGDIYTRIPTKTTVWSTEMFGRRTSDLQFIYSSSWNSIRSFLGGSVLNIRMSLSYIWWEPKIPATLHLNSSIFKGWIILHYPISPIRKKSPNQSCNPFYNSSYCGLKREWLSWVNQSMAVRFNINNIILN